MFAGNIYVDSHDRVWVSNNSGIGGLYVYDPDTDRFNEFIITTENGRHMVHSMAMAEDAAGNYWLGLWNGSLLRFDAATGQGRIFSGTGAYHIHSLLTDNPDEFLIGSDMGLTTFNPQTLESTTFKHDELNLQSLSDQFVHPLMRDREGALWVGTFLRRRKLYAPRRSSPSTATAHRPTATRCAVRLSTLSPKGPTDRCTSARRTAV